MEHIVKPKVKKRNGWDLEIQRLRQSNARANKINDALTFGIKALTLLFIFQVLVRIL